MTLDNSALAPVSDARFVRTKDFLKSFSGAVGLILLVVIVVAALLAPWIAPQDPYNLAQLDILDGSLPPGSVSSSYSFTYLLGTDDQGRDMLSAILYGLRTSIAVGFVAAVIAAFIGAILGLTAAYVGGRTDSFIMRLVDLQLSFPTILMALMILAILGKGLANVMLALVLAEWAIFGRTARATGLVEARKEYTEASALMGIPHWKIVLRHLLPNCMPPLMVILAMQIARAITLEATLSFLGVGAPVTQPSLGLLISNGFQFITSGLYWMSIFPGIALVLIVVAVNLIGDRLRDVLNPRSNA